MNRPRFKKFASADARKFEQDLVGLFEADAIERIEDKGMIYEIVERDSNFAVLTRDYKTNRVRLKVYKHVVTSAKIG